MHMEPVAVDESVAFLCGQTVLENKSNCRARGFILEKLAGSMQCFPELR